MCIHTDIVVKWACMQWVWFWSTLSTTGMIDNQRQPVHLAGITQRVSEQLRLFQSLIRHLVHFRTAALTNLWESSLCAHMPFNKSAVVLRPDGERGIAEPLLRETLIVLGLAEDFIWIASHVLFASQIRKRLCNIPNENDSPFFSFLSVFWSF